MLRYALFIISLFPLKIQAQELKDYKFINGTELTLSGKSESVLPGSYHRIDSANLLGLPNSVKYLATNSAGMSLTFQTNSTSIAVKWTLEKYKTLWNMTPLAVNGLDMYGWNGKSWQYVSSAKPSGINNSVVIIKNMNGKMNYYKVYLPLYTGVKNIEIGVEPDAAINPAEEAFLPSKRVVIYGSSITQGASASRPGMAYPAIIARDLKVETFNMGFSGSGKMEIAMADVLARMEADVYVLDCVPNPSPKEIRIRTVPFIKRLRDLQPDKPILMVESIFREDGNWNSLKGEYVTNQNKEFRNAYDQLKKMNFKNIQYIPARDLIGNDHEATVDGTHLTDLGSVRLAQKLSKALKKVL